MTPSIMLSGWKITLWTSRYQNALQTFAIPGAQRRLSAACPGLLVLQSVFCGIKIPSAAASFTLKSHPVDLFRSIGRKRYCFLFSGFTL